MPIAPKYSDGFWRLLNVGFCCFCLSRSPNGKVKRVHLEAGRGRLGDPNGPDEKAVWAPVGGKTEKRGHVSAPFAIANLDKIPEL